MCAAKSDKSDVITTDTINIASINIVKKYTDDEGHFHYEATLKAPEAFCSCQQKLIKKSVEELKDAKTACLHSIEVNICDGKSEGTLYIGRIGKEITRWSYIVNIADKQGIGSYADKTKNNKVTHGVSVFPNKLHIGADDSIYSFGSVDLKLLRGNKYTDTTFGDVKTIYPDEVKDDTIWTSANIGVVIYDSEGERENLKEGCFIFKDDKTGKELFVVTDAITKNLMDKINSEELKLMPSIKVKEVSIKEIEKTVSVLVNENMPLIRKLHTMLNRNLFELNPDYIKAINIVNPFNKIDEKRLQIMQSYYNMYRGMEVSDSSIYVMKKRKDDKYVYQAYYIQDKKEYVITEEKLFDFVIKIKESKKKDIVHVDFNFAKFIDGKDLEAFEMMFK